MRSTRILPNASCVCHQLNAAPKPPALLPARIDPIGRGEGGDDALQEGLHVVEADVVRGAARVLEDVVAGVDVAGAVRHVHVAVVGEGVGRRGAVEEPARLRQVRRVHRLGGEVRLGVAGEVGGGHRRVAREIAPAGAAALQVEEHARAGGAQVDADADRAAVAAEGVVERDPRPGAAGRRDGLTRYEAAHAARAAGARGGAAGARGGGAAAARGCAAGAGGPGARGGRGAARGGGPAGARRDRGVAGAGGEARERDK